MTRNWWEGKQKLVRKELVHITSILSNKYVVQQLQHWADGSDISRCVSVDVLVPQFLHSESSDGTTCLSQGCRFNLRILGLLSLMGCSSKITASKPCEKFFRCKLCCRWFWPVYQLIVIFWRLSCAKKQQLKVWHTIIKQGFQTLILNPGNLRGKK